MDVGAFVDAPDTPLPLLVFIGMRGTLAALNTGSRLSNNCGVAAADPKLAKSIFRFEEVGSWTGIESKMSSISGTNFSVLSKSKSLKN